MNFWFYIGAIAGVLYARTAFADEKSLPGDDCAGQVEFPTVQMVDGRAHFPEGTITVGPAVDPFVPVLFFAKGQAAFLCARENGYEVRVWHSRWKRVRSADLRWTK